MNAWTDDGPVIGPEPKGFISLRSAWWQLFVDFAETEGEPDLRPNQVCDRIGSASRNELILRIQCDAEEIIFGAIRFPRGSRWALPVWIRRSSAGDLAIADLHLSDEWDQSSIRYGVLIAATGVLAPLDGCPLYVQQGDWENQLSLFSVNSRASAKKGGAHGHVREGSPPLSSAKLNAWVDGFISKPENADFTEAGILQAIRDAHPDKSISRERVRQRIRDVKGPRKRGPKRLSGKPSAQ